MGDAAGGRSDDWLTAEIWGAVGQKTIIFVLGPSGEGTSFLAWALAHAFCRRSFHVHYGRISPLLQHIGLANADGGFNPILMIDVLTIALCHGMIRKDAFPMNT